MKATNILIGGLSLEAPGLVDPERLRLVLIDLDGLRLKRRSRLRERLRSLARLSLSADLSPHVTMADRARFLRLYLAGYGSGVPDWRALWRQIVDEREQRFPDHLAG